MVMNLNIALRPIDWLKYDIDNLCGKSKQGIDDYYIDLCAEQILLLF